MNQEIIEQHLKKATDHAYWLGIALGILIGLGAGIAIGYHLASDRVVVIPLGQSVEV